MSYGGTYNGTQSARLGNDESMTADSFQGGIADVESALMETEETEIDELMQPRKEEGGMDQMDPQMMQMLMAMMGGGQGPMGGGMPPGPMGGGMM